MAGSLNRVMLIGNLGRDPEIRSTNDGRRIANLSIATSDTWRDKNSGERKERTEWHRIVIFNEHLVEVVEKYVHKGDKIYVEGALQTRKWTDNSNVERYSTEVVLQNFKGELTMLSNSGGGNRPPAADSPDDYGDTHDYGGGSSGGSTGGGYADKDTYSPGGAVRGNVADRMGMPHSNADLDDEIPF